MPNHRSWWVVPSQFQSALLTEWTSTPFTPPPPPSPTETLQVCVYLCTKCSVATYASLAKFELILLVQQWQLTDSLCTVTSTMAVRSTVSCTTDRQMYSPPRVVSRGLNVRVRVVTVPDVSRLPTVMSPPVATILPSEYSHRMVGVPADTLTLQVRAYSSPAVGTPVAEMDMSYCSTG